MNFRLPFFVLIFLAVLRCFPALAQDLPSFAASPVATFHFSEIVNENVDADGVSVFTGGLHLKGRLSMAGVDLSTITVDTRLSVWVETSQLDRPDFSLDTTLAGGSEVDDVGAILAGSIAAKTLTFQINSQDPVRMNGCGTMKITWSATEMIFTIDLTNSSEEFQVLAQALADELTEDEAYEDFPTAGVIFAEHEMSLRTIYVTGTARVVTDAAGNSVARENIAGDLDSTKPAVALLKPATHEVINQKPYTVSGTASDKHLARVLVKLNDDPPVEATIVGTTWSLPGAMFRVGTNVVVITAVDSDGNEASTLARPIQYSPFSALTVDAAGTGIGKVTSGYFPLLSHPPLSGAAPTRTALHRMENERLTLTATPAFPGSVFDGWTSVPPLFSDESAKSARLTFRMQPRQKLTAHFIPNPFLGKFGNFAGLVQPAATGGAQGCVTLKLNNNGTFTGKITIGAVAIPLKGSLSNALQFSGTFIVSHVPYLVTLSLNPVNGSQQIVGTVKGGAIDSTITTDLATFVKTKHEAPQVGIYNVLLPAVSPQTATNFPVGIGYGRVTVGVTGLATFVGKLGDGTAVSRGATISESGVWRIFAPLYGKRGWISGAVTFDLADPNHDLAGTLEWSRPGPLPRHLPTGVHGDGFVGQSQIVGAKYVKPLAGARVFLNPSSGDGILALDAPGAKIPNRPALAAFFTDPDLNVNLATTNSVAVTPASPLGVKVVITASTGLFTGRFIDPTQANKVVAFSGAIVAGKVVGQTAETALKVNAAGGCFTRGDRTGSVQITAPPPPAAAN